MDEIRNEETLDGIVTEMLSHGLSETFVSRLKEIAQENEGAMDLLHLWFTDKTAEERKEVEACLAEVVEDYKELDLAVARLAENAKDYKELVNAMEIRNDEDLELATTILDELWFIRPWHKEYPEREKLVGLVAAYEDKHVHIPAPDPITAIKFRMEHQGLRPEDLTHIFGSVEDVEAILSGERELTAEIIFKLHTRLEIPLRSLYGEEDTTTLGEFLRSEQSSLNRFKKWWLQQHETDPKHYPLKFETFSRWVRKYELWCRKDE